MAAQLPTSGVMLVSFTEHGNLENHSSPYVCLGRIWNGSSSQANCPGAHSGLKCHLSGAFNPAAEERYDRSARWFRSRRNSGNCFRPCGGPPSPGRRCCLRRAAAGSFVSAGAAIKPWEGFFNPHDQLSRSTERCAPPEPRRRLMVRAAPEGMAARELR
jgi:hypothetical protein